MLMHEKTCVIPIFSALITNCQVGIFPHNLDSYGLTMIVNACQTLFIWKITVTSKFDSILNHPESDHQVSNMPVWVIRKANNLLVLYPKICPI